MLTDELKTKIIECTVHAKTAFNLEWESAN